MDPIPVAERFLGKNRVSLGKMGSACGGKGTNAAARPLKFFFPFQRALSATKGSTMDRNIITQVTMHSVSGIHCFERVVGVAMLRSSSLMHARAKSWRWAPSALGANLPAANSFAIA